MEVRLDNLLGHLGNVEKILVYAFGVFDRNGLPPALDELLFPSNGSSKDLTTLQVSHGHNDAFFAFDEDDRISHINTEFRDIASSIAHTCSSQPAIQAAATSTYTRSEEVTYILALGRGQRRRAPESDNVRATVLEKEASSWEHCNRRRVVDGAVAREEL
ncbi:hypothetical protein EDD37DRAFT_652083 [Exophiala viscosa]|uniref:uncharacterized protein n=1 Tax=Exophiala viscosa TaxID=2486360 RepID=UPI0021963D54|nr:hypothetical protein EDD37DRAFT_652083 [Exophiala viscosa]